MKYSIIFYYIFVHNYTLVTLVCLCGFQSHIRSYAIPVKQFQFSQEKLQHCMLVDYCHKVVHKQNYHDLHKISDTQLAILMYECHAVQ